MTLPFWKTPVARSVAPWILVGCIAGWVFSGCGSPASVKEKGALEVVVGGEGPGARWARGFGWVDSGRTLWLANQGDTTRWTRSSMVAATQEGGVTLLPSSDALALGTWSTTHVPFVRAIGAEDQWVASGYAERIADVHPSVIDLGGDAGLEDERLVASGVNVLTSYPFGNPMEGVTDRTGVWVLPLTEYAEPHPLGRAEYLRVFGWLTGRMSRADSVFSAIEQAYLAWADQAQRHAERHGRPVVFSGSSQSGRWTAPGAEGMVARLISDAGGAYAFDQQAVQAMSLHQVGANYEVELEQCAAIAAGSDFWGKVVYAPDGWTASKAQEEAPWCDFEGKTLFHCNTAEVDYFGQAVLEPHEMLADLMALFHGRDEAREPVYFKPTPP